MCIGVVQLYKSYVIWGCAIYKSSADEGPKKRKSTTVLKLFYWNYDHNNRLQYIFTLSGLSLITSCVQATIVLLRDNDNATMY